VKAIAYLCDDKSPALDWLLKRHLPLVFVDHTPRPGFDSVNIDDRMGALMAAQHLVDLGHRRISIIASAEQQPTGWVHDPLGTHSGTSRTRLEGWIEALDAAEIEPKVVQANLFEVDAARTAAGMLLDDDPSITAILCFSDVIAYGAMTAVQARGLHVPDDISVVGFDGSRLAARTVPPLTTVRQDVREKGRAAARALIRRMEGSSARARRVRLPVELIVAGSTAPPPS
jgi:DNA-binding LacI/PurR family transcriptional regulator